MITRLALSGLMRSGKDFVAAECGFELVSFSEPIYYICDYFLGNHDKSKATTRRFMQFIGQVGYGHESAHYEEDIARLAIESHIRLNGDLMMRNDYKDIKIDWREFGLRKDFWVNIGLSIADYRLNYKDLSKIAFVNVRFPHELQPLSEAGFEHFHVMCAEETRQQRLKSLGETLTPQIASDVSEQMAGELNDNMPRNRVIWNDSVSKTDVIATSCLSLSKFKELCNAK